MKFFRKKTPAPTVVTPAPLKVLEQSLTLADALLVYFETSGSYVRFRGALVQARRNQKDSGAAVMSDEDLTGIRRETLEAMKIYYAGGSLPPDDRLEKIITFERVFDRMSSAGVIEDEDIKAGLQLIAGTRETLGDAAPNIIDYIDDLEMLEAKATRIRNDIRAGVAKEKLLRSSNDDGLEAVISANEDLVMELTNVEDSIKETKAFLENTKVAFSSNQEVLRETESALRRLADTRTALKQRELVADLSSKLAGVGDSKMFARLADQADAQLQGMREVQADAEDRVLNGTFSRLQASERLDKEFRAGKGE